MGPFPGTARLMFGSSSTDFYYDPADIWKPISVCSRGRWTARRRRERDIERRRRKGPKRLRKKYGGLVDWRSSGYHYAIERDGTVLRFRGGL